MNSRDAYFLIYNTGVINLELEEIISKDSAYSYECAIDIIQARFELGEEAISKNGYYSYIYARDVLKDRFELGEEIISKNGYYSLYYAINVMRYNHE